VTTKYIVTTTCEAMVRRTDDGANVYHDRLDVEIAHHVEGYIECGRPAAYIARSPINAAPLCLECARVTEALIRTGAVYVGAQQGTMTLEALAEHLIERND